MAVQMPSCPILSLMVLYDRICAFKLGYQGFRTELGSYIGTLKILLVDVSRHNLHHMSTLWPSAVLWRRILCYVSIISIDRVGRRMINHTQGVPNGLLYGAIRSYVSAFSTREPGQ
jgi:hypothetical protein